MTIFLHFIFVLHNTYSTFHTTLREHIGVSFLPPHTLCVKRYLLVQGRRERVVMLMVVVLVELNPRGNFHPRTVSLSLSLSLYTLLLSSLDRLLFTSFRPPLLPQSQSSIFLVVYKVSGLLWSCRLHCRVLSSTVFYLTFHHFPCSISYSGFFFCTSFLQTRDKAGEPSRCTSSQMQ
jgi:hypothetical protein